MHFAMKKTDFVPFFLSIVLKSQFCSHIWINSNTHTQTHTMAQKLDKNQRLKQSQTMWKYAQHLVKMCKQSPPSQNSRTPKCWKLICCDGIRVLQRTRRQWCLNNFSIEIICVSFIRMRFRHLFANTNRIPNASHNRAHKAHKANLRTFFRLCKMCHSTHI